jgi:cell division protein FtsB
MEEYRGSNQSEEGPVPLAGAPRWIFVAVVALLGIAGIAFAYGYHQHALVSQLTAQASTSTAQMNTLQQQVNSLTAKLSQMNPPQPSAQAAAPSEPAAD